MLGKDKSTGDSEEEKVKKTIHKAKVEDDEYKTEEQTYYSIAHTIREVVTEQATIMVNGKLKEYQIKVSYLVLPNVFALCTIFYITCLFLGTIKLNRSF